VLASIRSSLCLDEVGKAIQPYKCNGLVTGHKVLDDHFAIAALLKASPDNIRTTIEAQKIKPMRMTQLLNQVLRSEWEMVKGKLTGKLSPRKLAHKAEPSAVAE